MLLETGIETAFKPIRTISQMLPKLKDKVKDNEKLGLLYQIPRKKCKIIYIGETKSSFHTRLAEHKSNSKHMNILRYALAKSEWDKNHDIDWDKSMSGIWEHYMTVYSIMTSSIAFFFFVQSSVTHSPKLNHA